MAASFPFPVFDWKHVKDPNKIRPLLSHGVTAVSVSCSVESVAKALQDEAVCKELLALQIVGEGDSIDYEV